MCPSEGVEILYLSEGHLCSISLSPSRCVRLLYFSPILALTQQSRRKHYPFACLSVCPLHPILSIHPLFKSMMWSTYHPGYWGQGQ